MWRGCGHGERPTRGTGADREDKVRGGWIRGYRYKISACRRWLKWLRIRQTIRNLRYKISGATNPLF